MGSQETPADLLAAERTSAVERIAGLNRELAGIIESAAAGADDEHDPEGATLAFERQHIVALLSQATRQLAHIDAAIGRLADGSYGQCVNCGMHIGKARLTARPATTTCIRCA
jgi:RNA polymerase-binding transcription factor DksA